MVDFGDRVAKWENKMIDLEAYDVRNIIEQSREDLNRGQAEYIRYGWACKRIYLSRNLEPLGLKRGTIILSTSVAWLATQEEEFNYTVSEITETCGFKVMTRTPKLMYTILNIYLIILTILMINDHTTILDFITPCITKVIIVFCLSYLTYKRLNLVFSIWVHLVLLALINISLLSCLTFKRPNLLFSSCVHLQLLDIMAALELFSIRVGTSSKIT